MFDLNFKNTNLFLKKCIHQVWTTKKYSYENIKRPDYGLLYLLSGKITYTFDDNIIELKAGDIIYLPKGSNYVVNFNIQDGIVEDFLINFDTFGTDKFADIDLPTCIFSDNMSVLLDLFKSIVELFKDKDQQLLVNSLFFQCLHTLQISTKTTEDIKKKAILDNASKTLSENFEISIAQISRNLCMSQSAFQKMFIQYYGVSPTEYRKEKRMEKAKYLLETTDIPIKEISVTLNFYDVAYFYKVFKNYYGLTPKEYRQMTKPLL